MTSSALRTRPTTTPAMSAVFDDAAVLRDSLAFEVALAHAEAAAGLISTSVAQRMETACRSLQLDPATLADQAAMAGTLALPLVAQLRAAMADIPDAAQAVHRGATSQDLSDTVLMMQAKAATRLLAADLNRAAEALAAAAMRYASLPAIGRTLLQDALPITFGLRIAQWLAGLVDARRRLETEAAQACVLQLGGASGTLTDLGGKSAQVVAHVAKDLGLGAPLAPWHARRNSVAGLSGALGIVVGALGKIARDVSLLAQTAVGEAHEPAVPGRGGSSAMAHKRNPTGCQVALSAAIRAPGLVAAILSGLPQEEERGLGGWQAEGPVLVDLFQLAGGAADAMAAVVAGLDVDEAAIARHLDHAGLGHDTGDAQAIVTAILNDYRKKS